MKTGDLDDTDDTGESDVLGGVVVAPPTTGTVDDEDDPNDEKEGENEAPVREASDSTEAPEEFEVDDEDEDVA